MVEKRKPGVKKRVGLTELQERFCQEMARDNSSQTQAAIRAGVKGNNPAVVASNWMNPRKYPLVVARIEELREAKVEDALMTGADVLRFAHTTMLACFTDYFQPGPRGWWVCRREDYMKIPVNIKRLIEEMEVRSYTNPITGETEETLRVKFVSKSAMALLAAKYQLTEKHQHTVVNIDWSDPRLGRDPLASEDPVEARIREVEERAGGRVVPLTVTADEVGKMLDQAHIARRPK